MQHLCRLIFMNLISKHDKSCIELPGAPPEVHVGNDYSARDARFSDWLVRSQDQGPLLVRWLLA